MQGNPFAQTELCKSFFNDKEDPSPEIINQAARVDVYQFNPMAYQAEESPEPKH